MSCLPGGLFTGLINSFRAFIVSVSGLSTLTNSLIFFYLFCSMVFLMTSLLNRVSFKVSDHCIFSKQCNSLVPLYNIYFVTKLGIHHPKFTVLLKYTVYVVVSCFDLLNCFYYTMLEHANNLYL